MLTYESTVWLIFRLIDSVILIVLAIWAFYRWGLPVLRKHIAQLLEHEADLKKVVPVLKEQADQLDKQFEDDAHDIERLEQKIRLWQQAIKRKQMRASVEKEDALIRLQKSDEQKQHNVRHQKFYATALKEAVDEAANSLEQKQPVNNAATVETLLKFMASKEDQ